MLAQKPAEDFNSNGRSGEWVIYWESYVCDTEPYRWELINHLIANCPYPQVIGGDVNEILANDEKCGGPLWNQHCLDASCDTLELAKSNLWDVDDAGPWFTWERGRMTETKVKEHLGSFPHKRSVVQTILFFQGGKFCA